MKPRNRPKWKAVLSSPFSLLVVLVLFALLLRSAWNIHEKAVLSAERLNKADSELAKLAADQAALAKKADDLSTDAGIENELREKYRAVRPGESVAVIVDGTRPGRTALEAEASSSPARTGFWRSLLKALGLL